MADLVIIGPPGYERLFPEAVERLRGAGLTPVFNPGDGPLPTEHIARYGASCRAVIAGMEEWDDERMALLPGCRIITKCGAGLDNIDRAAAAGRGIAVTAAPGLNANAVAELTIALILDVLRGVSLSERRLRGGRRVLHSGRELAGMTVGVVGWGNIGRRVADRLRGFDVQLVAYDPVAAVEAEGVRAAESLESLVGQSDVVTLHGPLTPATARLVGRDLLGRFKPGAYLVNTARGGLIDEEALVEALDAGRLAGAALDVLVDESGTGTSPLLGRSDVVVTPHLGAETWDAYAAVGNRNVDDVLGALAGDAAAQGS